MKDYCICVQIAAPPGRVWTVMSDIERWHEWTPTIRSIRRTNAGPFRIGARARVCQPKLPPADWMVTALDDGREFTWESRAPGIRVVARHLVEPSADGSRVTLSKMINQRGYSTLTDHLNRLCRYFNCRLEDLAEYVPDEELKT